MHNSSYILIILNKIIFLTFGIILQVVFSLLIQEFDVPNVNLHKSYQDISENQETRNS